VDPEFIVELFAPFGPVTVRRLFGGAGLFAEGLMFGLVFDGAIFLKVDDASIPDFQREGSVPSSIRAPKAPAASAAIRSPIGACPSGSTTIPRSWCRGPGARLPSLSAARRRRAGARGPSNPRSAKHLAGGVDAAPLVERGSPDAYIGGS
jgi:DNA transformation protein